MRKRADDARAQQEKEERAEAFKAKQQECVLLPCAPCVPACGVLLCAYSGVRAHRQSDVLPCSTAAHPPAAAPHPRPGTPTHARARRKKQRQVQSNFLSTHMLGQDDTVDDMQAWVSGRKQGRPPMPPPSSTCSRALLPFNKSCPSPAPHLMPPRTQDTRAFAFPHPAAAATHVTTS